MKIKIEGVYNSFSPKKELNNKTYLELEKEVKKNYLELEKELLEYKEIKLSKIFIYKVDWTKQKRGIDARFEFTIEKKGRTKLKWNDIYSICNKNFIYALYFKTIN